MVTGAETKKVESQVFLHSEDRTSRYILVSDVEETVSHRICWTLLDAV